MQTGLPLVPLDESLCEQAFLNLVQNAYEAMEDNDGGTVVPCESRFNWLCRTVVREWNFVSSILVLAFRKNCAKKFLIRL